MISSNSAVQLICMPLTRETTFYRRGEANKYLPTQWEIKFNLDSVTSGIYKLRLAMASATRADLKVRNLPEV